ncbi:hypothetical protein LVB77_12575 [Lysobacter sp. 5GHs7-4]|uniref:hypothetical protein n=1 Tax=Lysobacter sp. 5GHs7-4 TaxID=2904253 RepID=UPI001E3695A2|nr:hypothetical protein [Lysobacter sp. 5GHs7-4]UHQ21517.1 hypothetical protein LVB77_12575 [Lysobacter sp. 5GHs7-4]
MKHLESEGFSSICRGSYVEGWVLENKSTLAGLGYVNENFSILGQDQIRAALNAIETAFDVMRAYDFSWHALGPAIDDALSSPDSIVEKYVTSERDDPYYLILYLRSHRDVLNLALDGFGYAMYVLYDHE